MGKVEDYRKILHQLEDWDQYLLDESRLPGPRANLELVEAVAAEGDLERFQRYLAYDANSAPYGSQLEFLPVCGAVGLGRLIAEGDRKLLKMLRVYASDPRWRIREGVAIALQKMGDKDMKSLLLEMKKWSRGNPFEKRAVAAAICEPRLLKKTEHVEIVFTLLDEITESLKYEPNRKSDEFVALKKALAYCWSVAVVSGPDTGKKLMEKWFANDNPDVCWIMRENLKKDRLKRLDPSWVEKWDQAIKSTLLKARR